MTKSKSMKALDRLSELPDSLIFSIFGLLTMRDVVATTVLSKRWRNLWTTAPCLSFVDWESEYFITRALMFWRGTKILKFKIEMGYEPDELDKHITKNIESWVRLAKDYEVQELYLHLLVDDRHKLVEYGEEHHVPQYSFYLSSCPSLQVLSLKGCDVRIHRNVRWNQLKSLTITTENGLRCADIDHVLGCSPRLEVLVLRFFETSEHLTIRSTSLKKLSIDKFMGCYDEAPPMNTRLIISTTDLETLEISNIPYSYCSFSVSSLTEVSLLFYDGGYQYGLGDLFEEALKQILPRIQHVENVTLSYDTIVTLWKLISKHLAPRSWDVKFLKLNAAFSHPSDIYIVAALEFFSKVKMLVLEDISEDHCGVENRYLEFQPNLPNLTSVEVIWGVWDSSVLPLIEVLLKYASSLGKMLLRVKGLSSRQPEEELERLQRSFPGKMIVCGC